MSCQKVWRRAAILGIAAASIVSGCAGLGGTTAAYGNTAPRRLPPLPKSIAERGRFIIGVKCDLPPFGYRDSQNHLAGFDIQVAQRLSGLAFHQSSRISYVCVTTTSRIPMLRSGQVDMIIATLSWTKARAKTIEYSTPYFEATGRLLVRSGGGVMSLAALRGKTVVTTRGSVYVTWAKTCLKGTNLQQVDGTGAALSSVADGQTSGFLYDDAFLEGATANNASLTLTSDRFLGIPWGIGLRKNEATLRTWVDAAIAQMKAGDEFYKILVGSPASSGLSGFANQVPRPQVTLRYPTHENPLTDCRTS